MPCVPGIMTQTQIVPRSCLLLILFIDPSREALGIFAYPGNSTVYFYAMISPFFTEARSDVLVALQTGISLSWFLILLHVKRRAPMLYGVVVTQTKSVIWDATSLFVQRTRQNTSALKCSSSRTCPVLKDPQVAMQRGKL